MKIGPTFWMRVVFAASLGVTIAVEVRIPLGIIGSFVVFSMAIDIAPLERR